MSSMLLASHTVQVTTDAKARPIMTALTTMSAAMNMLHGDKSRGRCAASTEWGVGAAGAAAPGSPSVGNSTGVMTAGSDGAGAAAAGAAVDASGAEGVAGGDAAFSAEGAPAGGAVGAAVGAADGAGDTGGDSAAVEGAGVGAACAGAPFWLGTCCASGACAREASVAASQATHAIANTRRPVEPYGRSPKSVTRSLIA